MSCVRIVDGTRHFLVWNTHEGNSVAAVARYEASETGGRVLVSTPEGWHKTAEVEGCTPAQVADALHREILREHGGGS